MEETGPDRELSKPPEGAGNQVCDGTREWLEGKNSRSTQMPRVNKWSLSEVSPKYSLEYYLPNR